MQVETDACVATTRLCPPVTLLRNNEMCSILLIKEGNKCPCPYLVVSLAFKNGHAHLTQLKWMLYHFLERIIYIFLVQLKK